MGRRARKVSTTGIYHVMLRGINKQNLFEGNEDKKKFYFILTDLKGSSLFFLYGFCLMNNHIHLLIKENKEPISNSVKRISGSYATWYNKKYHRCGHLFQERFKSEVVETDPYFLSVLRYIHQNPLKAGIIKDICKYPWSSLREYIAESNVVDIDYALGMFSIDRATAVKLFLDFTNEPNSDEHLDFEPRHGLLDEEVSIILKELGFCCSSELQQLEKVERDKIIKELVKLRRVSIRQLARVTGISKNVIERVIRH